MSDPTFGYLASLVPALKTREVLHTAPAGKVVEGKIVVTHRDPYPVRIRIGVSTGGVTEFNPENYILYDREIAEGQSYESDTIYYGNNQSLVVWTDSEFVNFVIHGQIQEDPTPTGFVAAAKLPAKQSTAIYTVPDGEEALVSLFVSNQGPSQARFRLAISDENAGANITTDQYIEYNTDIFPRNSYQRRDIKVRGNQSIVAYSDNPDVAFAVYAKFNYSVVSTDFSVGGDLDVGGTSILRGALEVRGETTLKGAVTSQFPLTLGTTDPAIPAAGLSLNGNLTVKTPGQNPTTIASINSTTGLINTTGSLVANSLTTSSDVVVGANKIVLEGDTGNLTVEGQLDPQGGFAGDLNLLNNRVTNLANPATATDAANRRYVDSKVVAFSIALG